MNKRNSIPLWITALSLYAFMYAPLIVVMVFSFNASKYGVRWTGFTTKWYGVLFNNELALNAAINTLKLAGTSTLCATIIGTLLGYGMSRFQFPGKGVLSWFLFIPIVIPDILMAVSLLLFYGVIRNALGYFELGMTTMIVSHITFQISFVALVVQSRMVGMDPALEEAARDLGANNWQVFWRVTFPLMFPGILSGALLAFTLSLDDFVVSFFTTGPGSTTLPILIYSSVKRGVTPDINALSTIMALVSMILVVAATFAKQAKR